MAISVKELKRRGVTDGDIALARLTQEAQRRSGAPVHTLAQIIEGRTSVAADPAELTERQLRKRGRYGAAALLADQEALTEASADRALKARHASAILKELAHKPAVVEYDFFKGNWSMADEYYDTIRDRIHALPISTSKRMMAFAVLTEIARWIGWKGDPCAKTAAEIAELLKVRKADVTMAMQTLEQVGAIYRKPRGRTKQIFISPEGVYRGPIDQHAAAVDRYAKETGVVVPFRSEPL